MMENSKLSKIKYVWVLGTLLGSNPVVHTSKTHLGFYTLVHFSATRQKGKTLFRSLKTKAVEPLSGPQGLLYRYLLAFRLVFLPSYRPTYLEEGRGQGVKER
jgi:hypothetical protein